jgi:O-methyltransferase
MGHVVPEPANPDPRKLYLDVVERAITHSLYGVLDLRMAPGPGVRNSAIKLILRLLRSRGIEPVRMLPGGEDRRDEGQDRPIFAQTMIGRQRLANVRSCTETVIKDGIPGDMIEAGAWRGGAGIMMRAVLEAYGVDDRRVWLADSFAGLPSPNQDRYPADAGSSWHEDSVYVSTIEEVRDNFRRYGLLDDKVRFLQGWFSDTLVSVADEQWALIRVDADMYGSTIEAMQMLYPRLSPGGYFICDDYGVIDEARRAVDDYRREQGIGEPIRRIDQAGIYWRRESD